jgi:hypothetical protein
MSSNDSRWCLSAGYARQNPSAPRKSGKPELVRDNWEVRSCCLTKECYPKDCCRVGLLLLFFRGLPGAKRPAPAGFQLFRGSHFNRRVGRLVQAAQDHFFHAFGAPCFDPALQRS